MGRGGRAFTRTEGEEVKVRIEQEAAAGEALSLRARDRRKIRNVMVVPLRSLRVYFQETACGLRGLLSVIRRRWAGDRGGSHARLLE